MKTVELILCLLVVGVSFSLYKLSWEGCPTIVHHHHHHGNENDGDVNEVIRRIAEGDNTPRIISSYDMGQLLLHTRGLPAYKIISDINRVNRYENHFPLDLMLSVLDNGVDTIHSTVINLSLEEARMMTICHDRPRCLWNSDILKTLTKKLSHIIEQKYANESFVKISTASGKDATGDDQTDPTFNKIWTEYLEAPEYASIKKSRNVTVQMNYRVCALTNVHQKTLKVHDGIEAIKQLVNSKKITYHLNAALAFPNTFQKSIIIREWKPMKADEEFRGFVINGTLVAVSQFSYFCYSEALVRHQEKIAVAIETFFNETISPKFSKLGNKLPRSYMIDFIVQNWEKEKPDVMVLEVGGISVYQGLFDRHGKDADIFEGKKPFELRVLREMNVLKELKRNIPEWIPLIVGDLDLKKLEYQENNRQ